MLESLGGFFTDRMSDTIEMPGNHGGVNWGMTAADPAKGTMYVVSMDIPAILKNERREPPSLWQIPSRAAPAMQGKARPYTTFTVSGVTARSGPGTDGRPMPEAWFSAATPAKLASGFEKG